MYSLAAFACSGVLQKMAERYWSPTSGPWRLSWVGSWIMKNPSSSWRYVTFDGSNVTFTTSAWPVPWLHTSL